MSPSKAEGPLRALDPQTGNGDDDGDGASTARGEHAEIPRCRGKAPRKLRFELGLRAGREPLRYRSGHVRVS